MNSSKDSPTAPAEAETPAGGKGKAKKGGGTKGKGGGKSTADSTVEKDSGASDSADGGPARDPRDVGILCVVLRVGILCWGGSISAAGVHPRCTCVSPIT